ncbi:MAG: NAD(P)-dependent oxidoreductase, partial [Clostridia bacterium]|nr:NAD(P)-dependent oxidoreductase [Clostridia bacterium]
QYLDVAVEKRVKNVVFASSKAVYSGDALPWRECNASVPSSLYGASKLACEELGLLTAEKAGMGFVALRFAQVIGYGERRGYLIGTLIDNAISKRTQIIYGDGSQRRHYVYVKDVASSILCAAEHPGLRAVVNIGMQETLSNLEMAKSANHVFGNEDNLRCDPSLEMSKINDEMDISLAKEVLNFSAEYDIDSSFRDIASEAEI